jgi:hypothetical protein
LIFTYSIPKESFNLGGIPFITNGNQLPLAKVSNLPPFPTKTFDAANKLELVKNSITNIIDKININFITSKKYEIFKNTTKYYLYNILSNELIEIEVNILNLIKLVKFLINEKYFKNTNITDKEFIQNALNVLKKYL